MRDVTSRIQEAGPEQSEGPDQSLSGSIPSPSVEPPRPCPLLDRVPKDVVENTRLMRPIPHPNRHAAVRPYPPRQHVANGVRRSLLQLPRQALRPVVVVRRLDQHMRMRRSDCDDQMPQSELVELRMDRFADAPADGGREPALAAVVLSMVVPQTRVFVDRRRGLVVPAAVEAVVATAEAAAIARKPGAPGGQDQVPPGAARLGHVRLPVSCASCDQSGPSLCSGPASWMRDVTSRVLEAGPERSEGPDPFSTTSCPTPRTPSPRSRRRGAVRTPC